MKPNVTRQMQKWEGKFGKSYTDRNTFSIAEFDDFYRKQYGISRTRMNTLFLKDIKNSVHTVLEVGCNIGMQLGLLEKTGLKDLYGIEYQDYAIDKARKLNSRLNIIKGSALDIPYKDGYFDLVFTSGVLIHISPEDLETALEEIYRVSKRYIWGFEYYADRYTEVKYRGNKGLLWKGDFCKLYEKKFRSLKLIRKEKYPYLSSNNVDCMFLFEKRQGS